MTEKLITFFCLQDGNSTVVSHASKKGGFGSHNERFYEEYEYDRKLKKRRARLISAAEEAFTHIKRMQSNQQGNSEKKKNRNFFSIIQRFFFLFSERKSTNGIVRSCPSNIPNLVQAFTKISQSYQTTTQTFCGLHFATFVHLSVLWSFTQGLSWEIFSHNSCSSGKHNANVQKSNSIIGEMNQLQRNHRITAW